MNGIGNKRIHVGNFNYIIDESTAEKVEMIVTAIDAALEGNTVVKVPVLDEKHNRMTLYINGGQVDALVVDLDQGPPKPGEFAP